MLPHLPEPCSAHAGGKQALGSPVVLRQLQHALQVLRVGLEVQGLALAPVEPDRAEDEDDGCQRDGEPSACADNPRTSMAHLHRSMRLHEQHLSSPRTHELPAASGIPAPAFIHSSHAFQSADQVRCSRHSMAALQPAPALSSTAPQNSTCGWLEARCTSNASQLLTLSRLPVTGIPALVPNAFKRG